jgi:hypothetical protein
MHTRPTRPSAHVPLRGYAQHANGEPNPPTFRGPAPSAPAGITTAGIPPAVVEMHSAVYSTVTLFARLRGWSTSAPRSTATW